MPERGGAAVATVQNLDGANIVYLGDSSVSTTTGYALGPGQSLGIEFTVGEVVKVADGPFQNQSGTVEEIDPERGKLRVSVSIFGRNTLVDLEYWQVERS